MREIKISVQNKIATAETDTKIVCGNADYTIKFNFDDEWSGHNLKTALFVFKGKLVPVPFDGDTCKVPIIRKTTLLGIGVKTSDGELKTTTPAYIECDLSAEDMSNETIEAPTDSVYDEIISLLNQYITGGGSGEGVDLREYQKKVDEGLKTANKTIVGAINEVNEKVGQSSGGADGVSPTVAVTAIENGHRVTITDVNGQKSFDVLNGKDYVLTEADKNEIVNEIEQGLLGDINTALEAIIARQAEVIGGVG